MQIPYGPIINILDIGLNSPFCTVEIYVVTVLQRITFQHKRSYVYYLSLNHAPSTWLQYFTTHRHHNKNIRKCLNFCNVLILLSIKILFQETCTYFKP
jgi:uncharacterized membrane protein YoaT (DUF817 family)